MHAAAPDGFGPPQVYRLDRTTCGQARPALGRTWGWLGYCSALARRRQLGVDTSRGGGCSEVSTTRGDVYRLMGKEGQRCGKLVLTLGILPPAARPNRTLEPSKH